MFQLWETRIDAGCEQHNINRYALKDSLAKYDIPLNRKSLADISVWEPRTFKALADIAALKSSLNTNSEAKHIFITNNPDDYLRTVKKKAQEKQFSNAVNFIILNVIFK